MTNQACWIIRLALSLGELLLGVRALRKQGGPSFRLNSGAGPVEDPKIMKIGLVDEIDIIKFSDPRFSVDIG